MEILFKLVIRTTLCLLCLAVFAIGCQTPNIILALLFATLFMLCVSVWITVEMFFKEFLNE